MLGWLIVGGGPHGTHVSVRLLGEGISPERIRILDPHPRPLARWQTHAVNTGMSHLRSPAVHNLGVEASSLGRHADTSEFKADKFQRRRPQAVVERDFIPPYARPSLPLFMHQVEALVETLGLMSLWKQGRAESLKAGETGYRVTTTSGETLRAQNVVLALGAGDQLRWPEWARTFTSREGQGPLQHIFGPDFQRTALDPSEDVVVVGAGISGAQLALSLLDANPARQIAVLSRHSLRQADFDTDPGWLGPKFLRDFQGEPCYVKRRAMIQEARQGGSLASEVMHELEESVRAGQINFRLAHIEQAAWGGKGDRIELTLKPIELNEEVYCRTGEIATQVSETAETMTANRVVLATGFEPHRPGGSMVDEAVEALNLPLAPDGFPIVDRHLRWRPGLFVMGPLAELAVGPASRNVSGARMAAQRIVNSPEMNSSLKPPVSFQGRARVGPRDTPKVSCRVS